jgi:hypothetical protein
MDNSAGVSTEAEKEVLVVGVAQGGDEVADVFEFVNQTRKMRRGEGVIPIGVGHREAEDRDARRRGPRNEFHGGEGRGGGVGGEAGTPKGAFGEVEVQP